MPSPTQQPTYDTPNFNCNDVVFPFPSSVIGQEAKPLTTLGKKRGTLLMHKKAKEQYRLNQLRMSKLDSSS